MATWWIRANLALLKLSFAYNFTLNSQIGVHSRDVVFGQQNGGGRGVGVTFLARALLPCSLCILAFSIFFLQGIHSKLMVCVSQQNQIRANGDCTPCTHHAEQQVYNPSTPPPPNPNPTSPISPSPQTNIHSTGVKEVLCDTKELIGYAVSVPRGEMGRLLLSKTPISWCENRNALIQKSGERRGIVRAMRLWAVVHVLWSQKMSAVKYGYS